MTPTESTPARRRWRVYEEFGPYGVYEEVTPEEWDRMDDHLREILHLPAEQEIAFVRKVR